jgi:hypothetical protein
MSRSINKIILVGNIGRDPDVQTTASGTKVAHVSLATSRRFPRDGAHGGAHGMAPADAVGPARPAGGGLRPQGRPRVRRGAHGVRLVRAQRRDDPDGGGARARAGAARRQNCSGGPSLPDAEASVAAAVAYEQQQLGAHARRMRGDHATVVARVDAMSPRCMPDDEHAGASVGGAPGRAGAGGCVVCTYSRCQNTERGLQKKSSRAR